jgi:hypothetical protein
MNRYRNQNSSTPTTATAFPNPPVKPASVTRSEAPPTRFKVERSVYEKRPSQTFTVEAEYRKYVAGESSSETNILQFWEVRLVI